MDSLPPKLRAVAELSFIEDFDPSEIAARLGVCESTAKSRKARAIAALKLALDNASRAA